MISVQGTERCKECDVESVGRVGCLVGCCVCLERKGSMLFFRDERGSSIRESGPGNVCIPWCVSMVGSLFTCARHAQTNSGQHGCDDVEWGEMWQGMMITVSLAEEMRRRSSVRSLRSDQACHRIPMSARAVCSRSPRM